MLFFAKPGTKSITLLSSIKASLSLGLDFPVACGLSIGLKLLYSSFPFTRPVDIPSIPNTQFRCQLEDISGEKTLYTRADLINLYYSTRSYKTNGIVQRLIEYLHIHSFWMIAADAETHLVDSDTLKAFQQGEWQQRVVKRRRHRTEGKGEVLPLWRGGPISVVGHSWFVRKLFGVKVYEP